MQFFDEKLKPVIISAHSQRFQISGDDIADTLNFMAAIDNSRPQKPFCRL